MTRDRWDKRWAFLMAAIGSAVGLGNVWRFPYVAYTNGGGAFFIPFIVALITTGIPLVALEYYLGTRSQKGPTEAYNLISKKVNYLGWFSLGVASMICIYYVVILSWTLNYLLSSFGVKWAGIESDFFFKNILGISDSINTLGKIQWNLVAANFVIWLIMFLLTFKGVEILGKIVKWMVYIPWLMLLVLIIRGVTLHGAGTGLNFYLAPDFSQLLDPNVWVGAYGQIFYSLSIGFGIMIAYASYLPKESDINTNSWIVSFADCTTSFFAGFAVFSILGYLAIATNQPVENVVKAGPGLAFIIYPTAISSLPGGIVMQSIFGIIFFLILLLLGISSSVSLVETMITGLKDTFNIKRMATSFWVCLIGFLLGTIYTTSAGLYWLDLVDHWMNWGLVIVGLLEALLIGWFFNIKDASKDIDSTSEMKFGRLWIISIKYLTPLMLLIILISSIYKEIQQPYESYPLWALMTGGWFLLISLLFFAFFMQARGNLSTMPYRYYKIGGWFLSYLGLILTFYLFYTMPCKVLPSVCLILTGLIGTLCFRLGGKINGETI